MKIGILGGGQLGRMLFEASQNLGPELETSPVFHETSQCPAGAAGAPIRQGSVADAASLVSFFNSVDTFAIENEFLPFEKLKHAWHQSKEQSLKPSIPCPSWRGLEIAQDKLEQKKFFVQNGFPTSDFVEITAEWFTSMFPPASSSATLSPKLAELHASWGGLVIKKARMGYDGKGNFALPPEVAGKMSDVQFLHDIQVFCTEAFKAGSRVYAEKFVPFDREAALVSVRSFAGDYGNYPLIETLQKKGVCFLAYTALESTSLEQQAAEIARTIGERLQMLGTYAVEFFVQGPSLLVNEMAPRVHNSGHFTQQAARSSQFEMHLKAYAVPTFDRNDFVCMPAFAMVNLLGPEGIHKNVERPPASLKAYWYDKEKTSPGRKLGHILAQSSVKEDLPKLLEELKQLESRWRESLSQL